jgi:hypothetical protein
VALNDALPVEPTDLFLKGMEITNEALRRDYDEVLKLLKLHEQELVLLWAMIFGILGSSFYHGYRTNKILKELLNG